jgi:hypothetical protein
LIVSSGLNDDLAAVQRELGAAREELLGTVNALTDDALGQARRGGWTVRRVLQHLIEAEWFYAYLVTQLRGLAPVSPAEGRDAPASVPEAVHRLSGSRQALLAAIEGIDEASFYRLGTVGRDEYSVFSVLENAAHHDREHTLQMRSIVAAG